MSFYAFKPIVTVFSFTDMETPETNATERDMETPETYATERARAARALERLRRVRRRHPPLPAFAGCCIDEEVLEEVLVIPYPHRRHRRTSRRLHEIMNELDNIAFDMEPAPPRVILQSTHRGPFQEPFPFPYDHNYAMGPSGPRSSSGRLSAGRYQPQHILQAQDDGSLQRLELTLCAVCAAYMDALPRSDHLRVTPPDLEPMPDFNASPIED